MHTNEPTLVIEWRQLAYSGMVNFGVVKHSSLWRMEAVSGFSYFFIFYNQIRVFCLVNCSIQISPSPSQYPKKLIYIYIYIYTLQFTKQKNLIWLLKKKKEKKKKKKTLTLPPFSKDSSVWHLQNSSFHYRLIVSTDRKSTRLNSSH